MSTIFFVSEMKKKKKKDPFLKFFKVILCSWELNLNYQKQKQ